MFIIVGLGIVVIIVLLFLKMKPKATKTTSGVIIDDRVKVHIEAFINEIISDYYNEYRINYLSVRFNIKELESDTSYVFKTKRIGSLIDILDYSQVQSGIKYLGELILKKYNIVVLADNQLTFITEISRINGKIKAVESVKNILVEEDYDRLITELEDDVIYYKEKFTTSL